MIHKSIWVDACERWILDGLSEGYRPYYMNIMFERLPGSDRAIVQQMHRVIEKEFYARFCTRLCRHPRAASQQGQLPRLWLFPDLPVRKTADLMSRVLVLNAGGLHFNGPMLIPPATRFKGDIVRHIMEGQPYARCYIDHIHAIQISYDVHSISDYVAKTVSSGRATPEDILVLPRARSEIRGQSRRFSKRQRKLREVMSRFNLSAEVADQLVQDSENGWR